MGASVHAAVGRGCPASRHAVGDRWVYGRNVGEGRRAVALGLPRDRSVRAGPRCVRHPTARRQGSPPVLSARRVRKFVHAARCTRGAAHRAGLVDARCLGDPRRPGSARRMDLVAPEQVPGADGAGCKAEDRSGGPTPGDHVRRSAAPSSGRPLARWRLAAGSFPSWLPCNRQSRVTTNGMGGQTLGRQTSCRYTHVLALLGQRRGHVLPCAAWPYLDGGPCLTCAGFPGRRYLSGHLQTPDPGGWGFESLAAHNALVDRPAACAALPESMAGSCVLEGLGDAHSCSSRCPA
jgi:hypothetical protein